MKGYVVKSTYSGLQLYSLGITKEASIKRYLDGQKNFCSWEELKKDGYSCEEVSIDEVSRWISVKDDLPKVKSKYDSVPVIIARDINNGLDVVGCFYSQREGFKTDEGLPYNHVTHWMHVPEHPSKKDNQ